MRLVLIFVSAFFQLNGQQAKLPSLLHLDSSDLALFQQRVNNDYMTHSSTLKELVKADTASKAKVITPLQYKIVKPNTDSVYLKFNDILELQDEKIMSIYLFYTLDSNCIRPHYLNLADSNFGYDSNYSYFHLKDIDTLILDEIQFFTIECKAGLWFFFNDELLVLNIYFKPYSILPAGEYILKNYNYLYFNMTFDFKMRPFCEFGSWPMRGTTKEEKEIFKKKKNQ